MVGRADVARLAGVSPAVVSYVTNNSHPVAAKTRTRVLAAIAELGYRPNALARSLATARTHTLGLILPDSANPFFAQLAAGIEAAAFTAGYTVLFGNSIGSPDLVLQYVRTFLDRQVDGVIVCPGNDFEEGYRELRAAGVPVVFTDRIDSQAPTAQVTVDNLEGACLATTHLLNHGCKHHACVCGFMAASPSRARATGWRQTLTAAGLPVHEELLVFTDFTTQAGYSATMEILERAPETDAILVASDLQAFGVLRALADAGRPGGQDVAVVSFDGICGSAYSIPRLTTVAQPIPEISVAAVELLSQLITDPTDNAARGITRQLPTTLLVRESCGCRTTPPPRQRRQETQRSSRQSSPQGVS